jgi:hypothetical protein
MNKDLAEEYFDNIAVELRMERILSQRVVKSIAGVGDNVEVIPEYQIIYSMDI